MTDSLIRWETSGPVTRLILNQPKKLNALGPGTAVQFKKALAGIAKEKSKVVILSGTGAAFSAGGDMAFIEDNTRLAEAELRPLMRDFYGAFLSLRQLPQVTIAQINGAAVGAGLCAAMACDLRTVLSSAKLGFNFVRLGLNPGMAAWPLLKAAFGEARARDLLFTGRFFTGKDFHAWGGASVLAETPEELETRTREFAEELSGHSGLSLRLLKAETRLAGSLDEFLEFEANGQAECFKHPDIKEGVAAIKARRPPRFGAAG